MAKTLVYQMYPISWRTINQMTEHLYRIRGLGVDYVWISPLYSSPWCDHGYDVRDYRSINRNFGTMQDFDYFVEVAHSLGIKVLMDLVLNHTSTRHKWFIENSEYYCWSVKDRPNWKNFFDDGPAWEYDRSKNLYYLHLFHHNQADLNWFPDGKINHELVQKFQEIIEFWTKKHGVDGFRLDIPQCINKDITKDSLEFSDMLRGYKSAEVINAIFNQDEPPFIMMECFDPTFGEIVKFYTDYTPVSFVLNVMVKDTIKDGWSALINAVEKSSLNPKFMLDLESHDSPRFASRIKALPEEGFWLMFSSKAQGICLYQGQELGLKNPTRNELPDRGLMDLDAQTAMRYIRGEDIDMLRPMSRANTRVPLPLAEYRMQVADPSSNYNLTKTWIERWRNA